MDTEQLRVFLTCVQTLNFSEAARRCNTTQPTISRQIVDLEKEIGTRLFIRDRKSVTLTLSGKEFLSYASEIVQTADRALEHIRRLESGINGHLDISALNSSSDILSFCLRHFTKSYPNVLLDTKASSPRAQMEAFGQGEFDLYFTIRDMVPAGDTFDYFTTAIDHLCLIMPKDHRLAEGPLNLPELKNERFIITSDSEAPILYKGIMQVCHNRGYDPQIRAQYDSPENVLHAVRTGLGVSIIPESVCKAFPSDDVVYRRIPEEDALRIYVLAWQKKIENSSVSKFLDDVRPLFNDSLYMV